MVRLRLNLDTTPPFSLLPQPTTTTTNLPPPSPTTTNSDDNVSPSIVITVLVLAIAVILSASLYLLLRFLRRRHSSPPPSTTTSHHHSHHRVIPVEKNPNPNPLIDSLPLFEFNAVKDGAGDGDCAVCLSKFEPNDTLRLLPLCCHAFHADCIDTWLAANQSCPLCRSPLFLPSNSLSSTSSSSSSSSFRVEIGNVSRRVPPVSGELHHPNPNPPRRSYSINDGSFDYVFNSDASSELPSGSFRLTSSEFKADNPTAPPLVDSLAAEVGPRGGGGGWLKDYLSSHSRSSSRTTSFRGSGRWFFTGSSRRSTVPNELGEGRDSELLDLEASRLGDEIGELFRWLSGV